MNGRGTFDSAWRAAALYTGFALVTTWPLALHIGSSVPSDFGDPLLNAFILDWGLTHLTALASGDLAAFRTFWHAPIFHPEPLALAYSEHLLAEAIAIWPAYALGANILLCYNLLFLSTFVLSGVGMYLLARELTGSGPAAFVAGLLYGFALYRVPQFPHLQTLSSQWLPFALYGLRRFFVTRRITPLAGATLALVAQNLSNGYYLLFFSPLVAAYAVTEVVDRRLVSSRRVVLGLVTVAIVTALATLPVLVPYLALRQVGFKARGLEEVQAFSADALAWLSAAPDHRVWGWLRPVTKPEGELFPGLVTIVLAACAVLPYLAQRWRSTKTDPSRARRLAAGVFGLGALVVLAFTLLVEATGDPHWRLLGLRITMRAPLRGYVIAAALAVAACALSRRARALLRGQTGSLVGFFAVAAAATAILALGPTLEIGGVSTGVPLPYSVLYHHVPGFDGLRVPARFAMATVACLSVLAAFGARDLLSRGSGGRTILAILSIFFAIESTSAPIGLDERALASGTVAAGPERMYVGSEGPAVYRFLATLPAGAVVLEFPFGAPGWDVQSVFYQRVHGHPLVNGYSGGFPRSFNENRDAFDHLDAIPEVAWRRLVGSGATHVVVHRQAFAGARAVSVERWLSSRGARPIAQFGGDVVYQVPR